MHISCTKCVNHTAVRMLWSIFFFFLNTALGYPRLHPDLLHKRLKHEFTSLKQCKQSCRSTTAAAAPSHFRITSSLYICTAWLPSPPPPFFLCYLQHCKPWEQWADPRNPPNSLSRAATQQSSHSTQHVCCSPCWVFWPFSVAYHHLAPCVTLPHKPK